MALTDEQRACAHLPLTIIVYGVPGPQGSKKFMGMSKAGRGIMIESSAKVKPWREAVKWAAHEAMQYPHKVWTNASELLEWNKQFPIDGPINARMVFTVAKPKSAPKTRRTYPQTKPDVSKLVRSTEDALSDSGIWRDDARVVEYTRVAKVYPGEDPEALEVPGVRIVIELID